MLMRLPDACDRTGHRAKRLCPPSADALVDEGGEEELGCVPRCSTRNETRDASVGRVHLRRVVGGAAAAAPADQLLPSGVAPVGVCGQTTGIKSPRVKHVASGLDFLD
ncbi:uncharacterized protein ACO6RY_15109 [Pungitius sinensis]